MGNSREMTAVAVSLAALWIVGCSRGPSPTPAMQIAPPPETLAPPTVPLRTSLPTETTPSPALTPTTTFEPTVTFSPEIIATKPEEIAGIWLVKKFVGQGGMVKFPAHLTFREDGTFSFDEIDDPMHIFGGTFAFSEGKVTLDSEECYDEAKALFYHCTMTFTIFSTMQAGKPVRIRLETNANTGVFIVNLKGKNLMLDEP